MNHITAALLYIKQLAFRCSLLYYATCDLRSVVEKVQWPRRIDVAHAFIDNFTPCYQVEHFTTSMCPIYSMQVACVIKVEQ